MYSLTAKKMFEQLLMNNGSNALEIIVAFIKLVSKSIQLDLVDTKEATRIIQCANFKIAVSNEEKKSLKK